MKSQAQRAYLWANNPKLAKVFEAHTPKGKKLPLHVRPAKGKKGK